MKANIYLIAVIAILLSSCLKEHEYILTEEDNNKLVNDWIYTKMYNYYYWNAEIPINPSYTEKPDAFYKSLLFKPGEEDRFSWITDNAQENYNMLHGVIESFGFEYALAYKDTLKQLHGIVLYVSSNSPASRANIRRGDIFLMIDSTELNTDNYNSLLSKKTALYTFKKENGEKYNIQLTAAILKENPIFYKNIYEIGNTKIGYLVYNLFTKDPGDSSHVYLNELLQTFSYFKESNITEFVLDLRYNSGGLIDLAATLSSLIVPSVDTTKVALEIGYNEKIMEALRETNGTTSIKFSKIPDSYIGNNLKRVYIIIGHSTASASEAVINCLKPYMSVILIGSTTYGKNVGSMMFTDEYKRFNWAIQPIILKIYNSKGESDYTHGFSADIYINEFNYSLKELGNLDEPLLNKAIATITGESSLKSFQIEKETNIIYNSLKNRFKLPIILNEKHIN